MSIPRTDRIAQSRAAWNDQLIQTIRTAPRAEAMKAARKWCRDFYGYGSTEAAKRVYRNVRASHAPGFVREYAGQKWFGFIGFFPPLGNYPEFGVNR